MLHLRQSVLGPGQTQLEGLTQGCCLAYPRPARLNVRVRCVASWAAIEGALGLLTPRSSISLQQLCHNNCG